jgi:hypothetical protein
MTIDDSTSALISNLTGLYMISGYGFSETVVNGSQMQILACVHSANVTLLDSRVTNNILTNGNSNFKAQGSEIALMRINSGTINCSIDGLLPGFFALWSFEDWCSVETATGSQLPSVTLLECQVTQWEFRFEGVSNVQTAQSELRRLSLAGGSEAHVHNSSIEFLFVDDNATMWFINSTYDVDTINDKARIMRSWYLDVHVIDSIGQDVPSANTTINYSNGSVLMSEFTDANGRVTTILLEWIRNETGEYPIGAYGIEATYAAYSNSTTIIMTGNQQVTLELGDFIIPELPYFAILTLLALSAFVTILIHKKRLRF